ncbi:MAG TPA: iron-containing redox enzyme family protein [Steroidobacteraceae bacterium]|nr:iron-containing redox enzyme family protein [Steroidobacteraceae bacterium]
MSSVLSSEPVTAQDLLGQSAWTDSLKAYVEPDWQDVVTGEFARGVGHGTWSVEAMRGWILQVYPFIHTFPKFLAEALIKVEDEYSRSFLIDNIRVEKAHAEHWIWMGEGFGIPRAELMALAEGERPLLRDVQSLTDWIWYINAKGSLAEAVAATSFAIEGATGDLARALLEGFTAYGSRPGVDMSPRTSKWLRNHAKYDDEHPVIALQVVAQYARTERERRKCMTAARRSLQLLSLALLTSARHYSQPGADAAQPPERRRAQRPIAFPDRRVRGSAAAKVA